MKLTNHKRFSVKDTDVVFALRNPTAQEYNDYFENRLDKGATITARVALFDALLVSVENLEDDAGVIGVEQKDRIPAKWKAETIFKAFDENEVDEKK